MPAAIASDRQSLMSDSGPHYSLFMDSGINNDHSFYVGAQESNLLCSSHLISSHAIIVRTIKWSEKKKRQVISARWRGLDSGHNWFVLSQIYLDRCLGPRGAGPAQAPNFAARNIKWHGSCQQISFFFFPRILNILGPESVQYPIYFAAVQTVTISILS